MRVNLSLIVMTEVPEDAAVLEEVVETVEAEEEVSEVAAETEALEVAEVAVFEAAEEEEMIK